MKDNDIGKIWS